MARAETAQTRLPRGTGPVTKAFFAALDAVPDTMRAAVAKAAQGAIREELKRRLEKDRNAARALRMAAHPDSSGTRGPTRGRATRVAKAKSRSPALEPVRRKPAAKRPRAKSRSLDDGELG